MKGSINTPDNNNSYKVIYMDGGTKKIKLTKYLTTYFKQFKNNKLQHTPIIQKKHLNTYLIQSYPFQVDIDNINTDLNTIIQSIHKTLQLYYGKDINLNYYQFKRQNNQKYHLYYPNIIIKSEYMKPLINDINTNLKEDNEKIDTALVGNNIRMEGCLKYNSDTKKFEENSNYELENGELTLKVLKQIYNYDIKPTKLIKPFPDKKQKQNKIEVILNDIKEAKNILEKYKPYIVSKGKDSYYTYWTLKKECECLFVNRNHNNSNPKLYFNKNIILFKCWADQCNNKVKCLYKNTDANNDINFDRKSFNYAKTKKSIPLELGKTNYDERKKYFERFFYYICDENKLYRYDIKKYKNIENIILVPVEKNGYKNLKYHIVEPKSNKDPTLVKKVKEFVKFYTEDDQTNTFYRDIVFEPNKMDLPGSYNMFKGYGYTTILKKDDIITEKDIEDFEFLKTYIKNVFCENKQKYFNYFMAWLASILQYGKVVKPPIMIILYSDEKGTGKTSFFVKLLFKIIGETYCYAGNYEDVFGSFTTATFGKLLIYIDEFNKYTGDKKDKKDEDRIKKAVTDDNSIHKAKFKTEKPVRSTALYGGSTNHLLKLPKYQRRNIIFKAKKLNDNEADIKKIIDKIEIIYETNNKVKYLFGDYLANYKIPYKTQNDWIKNRPLTKITKEMSSKSSLDYYLEQLYKNTLITEKYSNRNDSDYDEDEYTDLSDFYQTQKNTTEPIKKPLLAIKENIFYRLYKEFCKANGYRRMGEATFKKQMKLFNVECIKSKKALNNVSNRWTYKLALYDLYKHSKIDEPFEDYHTQDTYSNNNSDEEADEIVIEDNDNNNNLLKFFKKK